ncbi:hypothetical protein WMY93_004205 [Mugilogobius chulae]|uniref:Class II aldolase/adducin N-terminal domain-containing protein n=1 Tax=Mugilogobius chulae TaxID=88201 RepID=A0AAW0PNE5_9GOBI
MSKSPTPKSTPVQRSPSDGLPETLQSPQSDSGPQLKKRISTLLQSPSFREELDGLIQEQMKKGGSSSNLWALRQLADYMSSHGSPSSLPVAPNNMMMVTPINDLQCWEPGRLVKGERLMRCKLASVHRLFDLYGWAQLRHTCLTLRVSKEQEHFLVLPDGLAYSEVTGSSLVSNMKSGLLPLSHEALLVGEVAYYDYNGVMEQEEDRVELQKSLGPTCKVLVLRNHGIVALGETVEEAFYSIYHIQAACQIQVSALCSGGEQNLILLDRTAHRPAPAGTVGWAGSTFGPLSKSRTGEHEFEALMRTLDNLGYRTGYTYRFPLLLERSRMRRDVEVPATVTAFYPFDEDGGHPALRHQFVNKQQQERTRWLNTPNTYQKISQEQASPGHHQRTVWMKTDEVNQAGSTPIKIENPNQFVPLFTNPREVIETRNKIRQQNRQDMKTAGPQSQVLAGVINEESPPSPENLPVLPPEPEPPNPFNELTDQELEEYRREVQRKQHSGTNEEPKTDDAVLQNGGEEEKQTTEELEKGMKALTTNDTSSTTPAAPPAKLQGNTPEGSPSKSPSKKKKKFKPSSFLKKSKKQKEKAES